MDYNKRYLEIAFSDGTHWSVPLTVVVHSRAQYYYDYEKDNGASEALCRKAYNDSYEEDSIEELLEWAQDCMGWPELQNHAQLLFVDPDEIDYEKDYKTAKKQIQEYEKL